MVLLLAFNGWSLNRVLNTCVGQEADNYPALERVAADTLVGIDYSPTRYSGCEDTGEPEPALYADVVAWDRAAANDHLASGGWVREDGTLTAFRSPTGEYVARVIMTEEEGVPRHAMIAFQHAE